MLTKHLKITGRVQGVGFRYSMLSAAHQIGITGWVKNCPNGSVEAIVQGTPQQVDAIIAWAQKGPLTADVDHVDVLEAAGTFGDFRITS